MSEATQWKRTAEVLAESEAYRLLVESMNDGLGIQDENGLIIYVNDRLCEMWGYSRDEVVGRRVDEFLDKASQEAYGAEMVRRRRGEGGSYELVWKKKDGGELFTIVSAEPLFAEDGRPMGSFAVLTDITDRKRAEEALRQAYDELELRVQERTAELRKANESLRREIAQRRRAEEALRESEERFRTTLDGMLEGCQIIGFDWRYLYFNDAVAAHGRRAKEELLGHTMMEMYPGIEDTEMFAFLRRCMEDRISHRMENEFAYPDGAKGWFELSIQPVPEGVFILSLDITERKRAEEALQQAREELEGRVERQMLRKNPYGLTFRELTVLHLVAAGRADKQIASELGISPLTVHKHVANILAKMNAASRTDAGVRAVREGLLD